MSALPRVTVGNHVWIDARGYRRTEWTARCEGCGQQSEPFDRSAFAYDWSDGHRGLDPTLGIAPCPTLTPKVVQVDEECRRQPHVTGVERTAAGIRSVAEDLGITSLPLEMVLPLLQERLARLAVEVENLTARDLLRPVPLAGA